MPHRPRTSDQPQAPITQQRGGVGPDEYQGLTASSRQVTIVWAQGGEGGLPDIAFRAVPLASFR